MSDLSQYSAPRSLYRIVAVASHYIGVAAFPQVLRCPRRVVIPGSPNNERVLEFRGQCRSMASASGSNTELLCDAPIPF
jgi:hypothetical protein